MFLLNSYPIHGRDHEPWIPVVKLSETCSRRFHLLAKRSSKKHIYTACVTCALMCVHIYIYVHTFASFPKKDKRTINNLKQLQVESDKVYKAEQ